MGVVPSELWVPAWGEGGGEKFESIRTHIMVVNVSIIALSISGTRSNADYSSFFPFFPADTVEPLGCFQEKPKRRSRRAMPVVYHRVEGINTKNPDISAIYEECRRKADEYSKFPIEVFGIKNYKRCVTTASGKEDQYSKYGESSKCAVCGGKGIGTRGTSIFAYKKQL